MTRSVYIKIDDVTTYLSESMPFEVIDVFPLGATKAERIVERSPGQHGDTDLDFLLAPRIITLLLQARISETYSYEYIRRELNKLFKATNTIVKLGIQFDDGTVYQIDTKSTGSIDLPFNIRTLAVIKAAITLRAASPIFYNPETQLLNFEVGGGLNPFTIPMAVPTKFGNTSIAKTVMLNYTGTFKDFPIITLQGPITNPVITNLTTGDKIDFTGITIADGDFYTIDLRFGRKIVYRNGVTSDSRIAEVTADSDLATFSIEAHPDVRNGYNDIALTGTAINNSTQAYIQYILRYDGI